MEKHFNLSRYKELLKLEEDGEISFFDPELFGYEASVAGQIRYNRKKDYSILIDEYLSRTIPPYEFRFKFLQMEKEDSNKSITILKDFQELESFTLAKDLKIFSDSIYKIGTLCFDYDISDETIEPMSESKFYYLVNIYSLQLQEAFSIDRSRDLRDSLELTNNSDLTTAKNNTSSNDLKK
jgi:hypothetical protein